MKRLPKSLPDACAKGSIVIDISNRGLSVREVSPAGAGVRLIEFNNLSEARQCSVLEKNLLGNLKQLNKRFQKQKNNLDLVWHELDALMGSLGGMQAEPVYEIQSCCDKLFLYYSKFINSTLAANLIDEVKDICGDINDTDLKHSIKKDNLGRFDSHVNGCLFAGTEIRYTYLISFIQSCLSFVDDIGLEEVLLPGEDVRFLCNGFKSEAEQFLTWCNYLDEECQTYDYDPGFNDSVSGLDNHIKMHAKVKDYYMKPYDHEMRRILGEAKRHMSVDTPEAPQADDHPCKQKALDRHAEFFFKSDKLNKLFGSSKKESIPRC